MDQIPDQDDRPDLSDALQQRLGERYPITVPISFAPPPASRWRAKPKPVQVMTEDWSYTGLGFVAETHDGLVVSLPVVITIGLVTGQALVQVVRPAENPEMSHYGIEFRDQALEDVARDLISIHLARVPMVRPPGKPIPEMLAPYRPDSSVWY
ncbi:MAG: PilZ domain-containing protein [Isosphaeraceae bacterium]